jgi:hypothetical protein
MFGCFCVQHVLWFLFLCLRFCHHPTYAYFSFVLACPDDVLLHEDIPSSEIRVYSTYICTLIYAQGRTMLTSALVYISHTSRKILSCHGLSQQWANQAGSLPFNDACITVYNIIMLRRAYTRGIISTIKATSLQLFSHCLPNKTRSIVDVKAQRWSHSILLIPIIYSQVNNVSTVMQGKSSIVRGRLRKQYIYIAGVFVLKQPRPRWFVVRSISSADAWPVLRCLLDDFENARVLWVFHVEERVLPYRKVIGKGNLAPHRYGSNALRNLAPVQTR